MELTRKQLEKLQRIVSERRHSMSGEIQEDVERARDETYAAVAGEVADPGDEAVADMLSDLDQAEVARDMRTIRELDEALRRIEDGSYGTCADCGGGISFERMRAYPTAIRCVDCQRVREKTYAHPGGSTL